jgi:2-polyprenyl-3-methyl-5-hydroxy-6-metoxy-1,4-benzoquinol methylase
MEGTNYLDMNSTYYQSVRTDIAELLPDRVCRMLEIGCGTGNTSAWIKSKTGCWTAGVELFPSVGHEAEQKLDSVLIGDIQTISLPFETGTFDLILCLDVLEHLQDPWAVVEKLTGLLSPEGCIISSLPNTRHLSLTLPLLLKGRFDYAESGLLDKTHLRFFVRDTAVGLLESAGLRVDKIVKNVSERSKVIYPFLGAFKEVLVFQYVMRAVRRPQAATPFESLNVMHAMPSSIPD